MPDFNEEENRYDELKKMANIATDLQISSKMRVQAINLLGDMATHESLLVLLNLAANDKLPVEERDLGLKRAREIIKKGR